MSANQKKNQKLGILTPGMGAVATTFYAGVMAARRGLAQPVGSLSQLGRFGDGPQAAPLREALPLAQLQDVILGGWDPYGVNAFDSAVNAGVLSAKDLLPLQEELEAIQPMPAVFDRDWVKKLSGDGNVKDATNKMAQAEALMRDIQWFKRDNDLDRLVMVWCASTEAYRPLGPCHQDIAKFEQGLKNNDPTISPSQIYTYAALRERVPFANGAPNLSLEVPALQQLAMEMRVPVAGRDFKTGQTLMKTLLAPGLSARRLGVRGWFSTNILGNRDGEVLDEPESFKSKEVTKMGVLESMLNAEADPELYGDLYHKVRINYYPPRGDDKEGWDNIDIFGWMGYPMQIKIDFLCKDSILAAPIVLDLALFLDLAQQEGVRGVQDWLGFYFKSPMPDTKGGCENDLFKQYDRLLGTLAQWKK